MQPVLCRPKAAEEFPAARDPAQPGSHENTWPRVCCRCKRFVFPPPSWLLLQGGLLGSSCPRCCVAAVGNARGMLAWGTCEPCPSSSTPVSASGIWGSAPPQRWQQSGMQPRVIIKRAFYFLITTFPLRSLNFCLSRADVSSFRSGY